MDCLLSNSSKCNFLPADPPSPTLTPSTLEEQEGTSVRLTCSAPAPCWSHPPTLTWTPRLGDTQETLQENQDKTKVMTSVLTFTASHLHHGRTISCTATYSKQDGSTVPSVSRALTLNITSAPQILSTSGCTKTAAELNCSCETVGNPPPILQWHSDELPLNQSDKYEALDDTGLRSYITVSQPQERDRFTLLCRSSNSVGSVTQQFYVLSLGKKECSHEEMLIVLIIIVGVQTAALISALLFAIRTQRTGGHNPKESQCIDDTRAAVMGQGLPCETENEVSITEEDIYVNTNIMRTSDKPNTHLGHQQASIKSSERTNGKDSDVIYSSVIWKSKRKKDRQRSGDRNPSGSCYPEESFYDNIMS
ncbi:titin-like [Trachinotus anak]|uniref:titin-like n=1 Tax=Trachinotus anak TaxID=443729 RepID=UPI0039F1DAE1